MVTTRRQVLIDAIAGIGVASFASMQAFAEIPLSPDVRIPTGDVHDFDFLVGNWTSVNRRLKQRFVGSKEWDEFPSTLECGSRLNGVVNLDYDVNFPTKGWAGMTVRTFNVEKRQWYIYWINSRTGVLFPPVVGGFSGDTGVFYGDDMDDGRPVKVRFNWLRRGPDVCHWEQSFSLDGKQWEKNWTVEHTRVKR